MMRKTYLCRLCEERNVVSKDLTTYVSVEKLDEISGKYLLENLRYVHHDQLNIKNTT